jgi:ectoine hydroxylase-related dioxygenase (phytanoyl-CoA dioxygenase family)
MNQASPLTEEHKRRFEADGFLILEKFIDSETVERLRARFEPLFKGEFETGLYPDEWNWQEGRDRPDRTRQICNAWKSDRAVASVVLSAKVGRCVGERSGWDGARICQDNVIWKPAGAKALGYHQDDSYAKWFTPPHMATCWIALDDTSAAGGTIEYARGSHKWGISPPIEKFCSTMSSAVPRPVSSAVSGRIPALTSMKAMSFSPWVRVTLRESRTRARSLL